MIHCWLYYEVWKKLEKIFDHSILVVKSHRRKIVIINTFQLQSFRKCFCLLIRSFSYSFGTKSWIWVKLSLKLKSKCVDSGLVFIFTESFSWQLFKNWYFCYRYLFIIVRYSDSSCFIWEILGNKLYMNIEWVSTSLDVFLHFLH